MNNFVQHLLYEHTDIHKDIDIFGPQNGPLKHNGQKNWPKCTPFSEWSSVFSTNITNVSTELSEQCIHKNMTVDAKLSHSRHQHVTQCHLAQWKQQAKYNKKH